MILFISIDGATQVVHPQKLSSFCMNLFIFSTPNIRFHNMFDSLTQMFPNRTGGNAHLVCDLFVGLAFKFMSLKRFPRLR